MEETYFKNNDLAYTVWNDKYRLNNETLEDFFIRLAKEFARLDNFKNVSTEQEKNLSDYGKNRLYKDRYKYFLNLFKDFKFIIPGGSVLAGLGSNKPVSLSNCFVVDTNDSIEAIFDTASKMSQIYKRRGGVGVDLSSLRPNGAGVNNAAKTTGGVVPFMELFSQITNTIGQSGRRGALMLSIDISHPDSPEFITSKQNLSKITGANISVKLTNEFKKAVENDEDYILRWPCNFDVTRISIDSINKYAPYNELKSVEWMDDNNIIHKAYVKKIRAKELWDSIIQCAWNSAEPGVLYWDTILDNDPASVYDKYKAVSTNPCGEIPLSPYDSCRLIASNLYSLVDMPFTENASINDDKAYSVFYEAQIIGDILVDLELEHVQRIIDSTKGKEKELWENIKEIGQSGRRTGVGLLGLGDMFAALGANYGDPYILEYIMKLKQKAELDASIDLAIINGAFPDYDVNLEFDNYQETDTEPTTGKNKWYQFLIDTFPEQFERMLKFGRRNISFSTVAPTGSISILAGTSSGCEPVFSLYYTRRKKCNPGETPDFIDVNGVGFKNFNVVHPKLEIWYNKNRPVTSTPNTRNLSEYSKEELDELIKQSPWNGNTAEEISPSVRVKTQSILQKYTTHSISSTVNLSKDVTPSYIQEIYEDAWNSDLKGITCYRDGCRDGILIKSEEVKQEVSKVRPEELKCKVEQFKNEKKDWIALVGLLDNSPYEIFTGVRDIDEFPIPSSVKEGVIIKVRQEDGTSRYDFRYIDSYGYTNTLGGLSRVFDKEYWNYGRLISGYLRSGMPIHEIINIIEGLTFTNKGLSSWKSGVIRALKVFIKDGTKVEGVKCSNCGSTNVVYESGCSVCRDCGSSKCG